MKRILDLSLLRRGEAGCKGPGLGGKDRPRKRLKSEGGTCHLQQGRESQGSVTLDNRSMLHGSIHGPESKSLPSEKQAGSAEP